MNELLKHIGLNYFYDTNYVYHLEATVAIGTTKSYLMNYVEFIEYIWKCDMGYRDG